MAAVTEVKVTDVGPVQVDWWAVGVISFEASPPRIELAIGNDGPDRFVSVGLGETFTVGADTWRFEDFAFRGGPHQFIVTLRVVPPGAPPFVPPPLTGNRVWNKVQLQHPGPIDENQIAQLEAEFGQRLPNSYRRWLAANNGAIPPEIVALPGSRFPLLPTHPLMGIHPGTPNMDLRHGRQRGAGLFTDQYMVIAVSLTATLAVRVAAPEADLIVGLDNLTRDRAHTEYAQRGYATVADYICGELLTRLAPEIFSFEAGLQSLPPMAPATFAPPPPPLPGTGG